MRMSLSINTANVQALIRQQRLNDTEGSFDAVALHGLRDIRASSGQLDCSLLVTREVASLRKLEMGVLLH